MGHRAWEESHVVVLAPGSTVLGWECLYAALDGTPAFSTLPVLWLLNHYIPPSFTIVLIMGLLDEMKS